MGGSKSSSSSKPKDVTPGAFKELQQPYADVIGNLIGQYIPEGTQAIMQGYQGPLTTAPTTGETQALGQVQQIAQGGGTQLGPAPQAIQPGQASQQLTGNILGATGQAGTSPQAAAQFVQGLGLTPQQQGLPEFQQQLAGASQTGAFGGDPNANPFLQAYIEQAQRPVLQGLEETLSRTLPGRFTQAGQFIQPGSSSAFDRAAALATRGVAQELGDISTRMSFQDLQAAQGREAEALGAELSRRGQSGLQTQALTSQAQQQQLDRALQVPGMLSDLSTAAQQREALPAQQGLTQAQTQATGAGIQQTELQSAIQNMQAQALPRLIQDLGVERGIEAFNNQVNSLLSTLGIGAGVTRPVIAQEGKSSSKGFSL